MKPILILSKAMKSSAWAVHGNMSPTTFGLMQILCLYRRGDFHNP